MLLAVETSGMQGSIALAESGVLLEERIICTEGRRHAQTLVSEVDELLTRHQFRSECLSTVAVSIGPGSFTGLRVGLAFASTLSWLHDIPLVAVSTLEAMACQLSPAVKSAWMICDAQRDEVFTAPAEWNSQQKVWQLTAEIQIAVPADLIGQRMIAGTVADRYRPLLQQAGHSEEIAQLTPRAADVAMLGHRLAEQGCFCTPETLEPLYIRASYAEEKRDAAKRAAAVKAEG